MLKEVPHPNIISFIYFLHQVINTGQALQTLGAAFLNIMWPYELANQKWLLYPASMKFEGHPETQCTSTGALNPLKLPISSPAGLQQAVNIRVSRAQFIWLMSKEIYTTPPIKTAQSICIHLMATEGAVDCFILAFKCVLLLVVCH